jgi:hypothetical protein
MASAPSTNCLRGGAIFKPVSEWRQDVIACLFAKIEVEQDRLEKADGAPTTLQ